MSENKFSTYGSPIRAGQNKVPTAAAAAVAYASPVRRGQKPTGEPIGDGRMPANKAVRALFQAGKPTTTHTYAHEGKHGSIPRPINYTSPIRQGEIVQRKVYFREGEYMSPIRRYGAVAEQPSPAEIVISTASKSLSYTSPIRRYDDTSEQSSAIDSETRIPLRHKLLEGLPADEETQQTTKPTDEHQVLARHNDDIVRTLSPEAEPVVAGALTFTPSKSPQRITRLTDARPELNLSRVLTLSRRREAAGVYGGKSKYEYLVVWRPTRSPANAGDATRDRGNEFAPPQQAFVRVATGEIVVSQSETSWVSGAVLSRDSRCALLIEACDRREMSVAAADDAAPAAPSKEDTTKLDALYAKLSAPKKALSKVDALSTTFHDGPSSQSAELDVSGGGGCDGRHAAERQEAVEVASGVVVQDLGVGLALSAGSKKLLSLEAGLPPTVAQAAAAPKREAELPAAACEVHGSLLADHIQVAQDIEEQHKREDLRITAERSHSQRDLGLTPSYVPPTPTSAETWAEAALAMRISPFDGSATAATGTNEGESGRNHAQQTNAGTKSGTDITGKDRAATASERLALAGKELAESMLGAEYEADGLPAEATETAAHSQVPDQGVQLVATGPPERGILVRKELAELMPRTENKTDGLPAETMETARPQVPDQGMQLEVTEPPEPEPELDSVIQTGATAIALTRAKETAQQATASLDETLSRMEESVQEVGSTKTTNSASPIQRPIGGRDSAGTVGTGPSRLPVDVSDPTDIRGAALSLSAATSPAPLPETLRRAPLSEALEQPPETQPQNQEKGTTLATGAQQDTPMSRIRRRRKTKILAVANYSSMF